MRLTIIIDLNFIKILSYNLVDFIHVYFIATWGVKTVCKILRSLKLFFSRIEFIFFILETYRWILTLLVQLRNKHLNVHFIFHNICNTIRYARRCPYNFEKKLKNLKKKRILKKKSSFFILIRVSSKNVSQLVQPFASNK